MDINGSCDSYPHITLGDNVIKDEVTTATIIIITTTTTIIIIIIIITITTHRGDRHRHGLLAGRAGRRDVRHCLLRLRRGLRLRFS